MNSPISPALARSSVCTLDEVLAYQNKWIIHKFLEKYSLPFSEAEELFEQTKKWLWLNAISIEEEQAGAESIELFIDGPMAMVDEMWHTFILFTREYKKFCRQYFGFFIHHGPTTKLEKDTAKQRAAQEPEAYLAELEAEFERQYAYIYDRLGEDTLRKWYSEYTDRYTSEFINEIRKPY
ncbi:MAG: hypothetical protein AAFV95_26945 [Bacteroidota bacterium]